MEQLDEKSFLDKYYFDNHQTVTVVNPTTEDYEFKMVIETGINRATARPRVEQRTFRVRAGSKERFIGSVANLYLDQMSKKISQEAQRFGDMADWNAKGGYYEDLIVSVDDPLADRSYVPFDDDRLNGQVEKEVEEIEEPFASTKTKQPAKKDA